MHIATALIASTARLVAKLIAIYSKQTWGKHLAQMVEALPQALEEV